MKSVNLDEYKLLDTRNGMKLENWNGITLLRPDPEIIWDKENEVDYNGQSIIKIFQLFGKLIIKN